MARSARQWADLGEQDTQVIEDALSLAATVVLAKLVGCMLPIAAKQLHMDPAIMASPLITTIVDAGAVLIYFQAAAALLRLPV